MSDSTPNEAGQHGFRLLGGNPRLRATLISTSCGVLGALVFLVLLGMELEETGGDLPGAVVLMVFLDAVIGLSACAAVGPIKGSRFGNLAIVVVAVGSTWAFPAWVVSVVRIGARRSLALDAVVVLVTVLGGLGYNLVREPAAGALPGEAVVTVLGAAALTGGALLWGRIRGTRAALVTALREQARSAEQARRAAALMREAELAQARAEERRSIARDMHDGISHQLAIVAMHAGALSYRVDLTTDQQRLTSQTVREAASNASAMLREALTALRETDDIRPTSPLPTGASLLRMVEAARAEGDEVSLTWKNTDAEVLAQRPQRAMTLARITEELLMNSRKHAPEAAVSILIEGTSDAVVLRVSNAITHERHPRTTDAVGTGLGLVGVTERAELIGGSTRYGATEAGTFDVEVRLP